MLSDDTTDLSSDVVSLSALPGKGEIDDQAQALASRFLTETLQLLTSDLSIPGHLSRRLYQIERLAAQGGKLLRTLGAYDYSEHRALNPHALPSGAETVGAKALKDGMAVVEATQRARQIESLTNALRTLRDLPGQEAQIAQLQIELNLLVSGSPPSGTPDFIPTWGAGTGYDKEPILPNDIDPDFEEA